MSLVHCDELGLNGDILVFDGTSDSIAKNDNPLTWSLFSLSNEHAILTASDYLLESSHVLDVLFVNDSVPEDDTHVLALWLLESENKCVVEVRPQILWLDVCKKDVRIHSKPDTETKTFPAERADKTRCSWHS